MLRLSLVLVATALLGAGCGAARETTSSTTEATPPPVLTAAPTPSPTPEATATPSPTPKPVKTSAPAAGPKLAVDADPSGQLKFTETELTAKAGNTTIDFKNTAQTPHNVAIRKGTGDPLVETDVISGDETTANVKLAAGTYEFYCSVPGHEEAGMKGTLTVR